MFSHESMAVLIGNISIYTNMLPQRLSTNDHFPLYPQKFSPLKDLPYMVFIYVHRYIHIYVLVCVFVCMWGRVSGVYACMCVRMRDVCMCVYVCGHVHVCVCAHEYVCVLTCVCVCLHARVHVCVYVYLLLS